MPINRHCGLFLKSRPYIIWTHLPRVELIPLLGRCVCQECLYIMGRDALLEFARCRNNGYLLRYNIIDWANQEGERVGLVSHDAVFFQWASLSAAISSQASNSSVKMQEVVFAFGQLIGVACHDHVHIGIGKQAGAHPMVCDEDCTTGVLVRNGAPLHILPVPTVLRTTPIVHHAVCRDGINTHELTVLAVRIVVLRTSAIICEL